MKSKGEEKVGSLFSYENFRKKKGAYQPMNMNPYLGFKKAVNFKSFLSQLFRCCTKN